MHNDISALPKGTRNQADNCFFHTRVATRALEAWHSLQSTPLRGRRKGNIKIAVLEPLKSIKIVHINNDGVKNPWPRPRFWQRRRKSSAAGDGGVWGKHGPTATKSRHRISYFASRNRPAVGFLLQVGKWLVRIEYLT